MGTPSEPSEFIVPQVDPEAETPALTSQQPLATGGLGTTLAPSEAPTEARPAKLPATVKKMTVILSDDPPVRDLGSALRSSWPLAALMLLVSTAVLLLFLVRGNSPDFSNKIAANEHSRPPSEKTATSEAPATLDELGAGGADATNIPLDNAGSVATGESASAVSNAGARCGPSSPVTAISGRLDSFTNREPGEKILFEGRWIEEAVKQKRAERLARRALKEMEAYFQSRYGQETKVAEYGAPATIVTSLRDENSYLVIGCVQRFGQEPHSFVAEVRRSEDATWKVVNAFQEGEK